MGANDGLVSTSSLIIGVAAAGVGIDNILLAGVAGGIAGAMSMAAGEFVSVSSQADAQTADLDMERQSLAENPEYELAELTDIYRQRGLDESLAEQVAEQLMAHDALGAHARDEIGIHTSNMARPLQAALSSAATFVVGAALPLLVAWLLPLQHLISAVAATSLGFLALLGALAARAGGAAMLPGALRVTLWGALAMLLTAGVGQLFEVFG
jgi:VIT1/CCC1 family predicted Fe2+/Mn2+ transporter